MQIFIIDEVPELAATMLCDAHLRKMCLETAQILSSVLYLKHLEPLSGMPKPYNIHHPVITAVDNSCKINWLLRHNLSLHEEYCRRFGRMHAYYSLCSKYRTLLFEPEVVITPHELTFARNFKDISIPEPDIIKAYRIYYRYKKSVMKNWHYTNSAEPGWLTAF